MISMRVLLLLLLVAALAGPPEAESCGPFLTSAQFSYVEEPPQGVFARGQLGILRTSYMRRNLVVAYRYLSGAPLAPEEIAAFSTRRAAARGSAPLTPVEEWLAARKTVPGAAPLPSIDPFRNVPGQDFESYLNCPDDSFARTARTLADRASKWGAADSRTAEWLRGQDAVFHNCAGGKDVPPQLSEGDSLLQQDRRYQIAAAEFYSEQYDAAGGHFSQIADDAASPWRESGAFMVARTFLREATVAGKKEKLVEARTALEQIAADPRMAAFQNSARGLLDYVAGRLDPDAQIEVLSERLMRPAAGAAFAQSIRDFTILWFDRKDAPPRKSGLTDWIATFQAGQWEHAVEQWRATSNRAWLIAALSSVPHDNPAAPELMAAARKVDGTDPAWASVTFYGISLALARDETEEARRWADQALAAKAPPDVRNEFLAQRMRVAAGWRGFLRYAPRTPVAMGGDLGSDEPLESSGPNRPRKLFDADFTLPLNETVPLERWADAASSPLLPRDLQADIARAGWVRAVVLDRGPQAHALAARWLELRPEMRASLQPWLDAKDPDAARFEAVLLMLRNPGLEPIIRNNFGRTTPQKRIDDFRDNWWDLSRLANLSSDAPHVLPAAEGAAGEKEWQQLKAAALRAPDYLCGETVRWVRAHPDDPRAPESLYLAVRSTRYTLGEHTTTFPKQAFTLLHLRYPKSPWAAKAPYWY